MKARVFAVLALAALPLGVVGASAEQEQDQQRFRGMDRNRDGVITRAEWRGSAQSFRTHDWNGDGRLSGDEIRPGAQRSRVPDDDYSTPRRAFDDWTAEGFRYLDRNRDGRVARNEWFDDRDSFVRADTNRDNDLTRAEFLAMSAVSGNTGFEALDRNNNSRIERWEWRGQAESFETADRDNDGVLSRSEMLPAADDSASNTFISADLNRDNRLSQREWQWSRRVFTDQDTNRDGFVGREEFWDPGAATGTSGYADNRTVNSPVALQVNATERWVDTGLDTRVGDLLRITSTGTVRLSNNLNDQSSPAGTNRRADQAPLPFYPAGALIARISDGTPFFIGDGTNVDRVNAAGRLYLTVNDDHLGDNSGSFRVTITIRPQ